MNYLLIGYGIVGSNVVDYLDGTVTVVESNPLSSYPARVEHVVNERLTTDNFALIFQTYTQPGDVIIDTAVELDTYELCCWAHQHGRHYINTVCDKWLPTTLELTNNYRNINNILYQYIQQPLEAVVATRTGPTCLMGHGANIGMVNHFFKMAVLERAQANGVPVAAQLQEVSEVYILEKDTLVFQDGYIPDEGVFYNTWNILEFIMESSALADYPAGGHIHRSVQPEIRDVFLGDICLHGRVVSHEETYTLDAYLQSVGVKANKIQFLYECSPIGEMSRIKYPFGSTYTARAATTELKPHAGYDLVGTLVTFRDGSNWFYGYRMMQATVPDHARTNATAWYVSAGVLAGISLIQNNPGLGINFPEHLPFALNEAAVAAFIALNPADGLISKPIDHLFISPEYPTYEVFNLYQQGKAMKTPYPDAGPPERGVALSSNGEKESRNGLAPLSV